MPPPAPAPAEEKIKSLWPGEVMVGDVVWGGWAGWPWWPSEVLGFNNDEVQLRLLETEEVDSRPYDAVVAWTMQRSSRTCRRS